MKRISMLPVLLFAPFSGLGAQTGTQADASAAQITVTPQSAQKVIVGTPNHFTGSARVQSLFDAKAPSHDTGGIVTFQPGARSVWHTHPIGAGAYRHRRRGLGAGLGWTGPGHAQR